ncbi:MAG TPA: hypothetical protein VN645_09330 [Steroidobacteraceae bacterium]|nr:hypothetical protein [Steroidobacteraceae bacterium]
MSAEEEKPDQLAEAYRRASADEAGRPGDAVRRAILDEAKAAARRRQPVANDSRYMMRAVAGIAVIGVAVVLWRQMDHRLPGEVPSTQAAPEARLEIPRPEAQPAISPPAAKAESAPTAPAPSERASAAPAAPAPERQQASSISTAKDVAQESRADAAADNAAAGAARGQLRRAESMVAPQINDPGTEVLIQYFPQQYNSDTPHSLWLVRDAAGRVLQSGEIVAGRSLEDSMPQIQQQLGGRKPGVWREQILLNARGQQIRLMTTTLP